METTTTVPEERVAPPRVDFGFYDAPAIGIATFLGSPLAGGALLALNFHHLGRGRAAALSLLGAVAMTAGLVTLGFLVDLPGVNTGLTIGLVYGMVHIARATQAAALEAHTTHGGRLASRWAAAGIGVAFLLALLGGLVGWAVVDSDLGEAVPLSGTETLHLQGDATEAEGREIAEALRAVGVLSGGESDVVFIDEDGARTVWIFVGEEPDADGRALWRMLAENVRSRLKDIERPLVLSLRTPEHEEIANLPSSGRLGRLTNIGDYEFFARALTSDQQELTIELLREKGWLSERVSGAVLVDGERRSLCFILGEEVWDAPATHEDIRGIREPLSGILGGTATLEICDGNLNAQRTVSDR